jgi:hypothetical protein
MAVNLKLSVKITHIFSHILIYIQNDAMLHSLSGNCSICYHHSLSGAQTTISTASGICHTFIAICRYRAVGGVRNPQHTETSFNSSMIVADSNNGVTNTRCCRYSYLLSWWWVVVPPKICTAVSRENKLCNIASFWICIRILLRCTDSWTLTFWHRSFVFKF